MKLSRRKIRLIRQNFDEEFYLAQSGDVAAAGADLLEHYVTSGWREGRNPIPGFWTQYYLQKNPDVAAAGVHPYWHYLTTGRAEGRKGRPDDRELCALLAPEFDEEFYRAHSADVAAAGRGLLEHYVRLGWREGRNPNRAFWTQYYLVENPDVAASGVHPFWHYLAIGREQNRRGRPDRQELRERIAAEFDEAYYLEQSADVAAAEVDPVEHYVDTGWREGRNPVRDFWTSHYLARNPGLAAAGVHPYWHYLTVGRWQGREGRPDETELGELFEPEFDPDHYLAHSPDVVLEGTDPLEHFVAFGWREGRDPNVDFCTRYYLEKNPSVAASGVHPFWHYLTVGRSEGRAANRLQTFRREAANRNAFDAAFYASQAAAEISDPLGHYYAIGDRLGRRPSRTFDPGLYRELHPGLGAGFGALEHYLEKPSENAFNSPFVRTADERALEDAPRADARRSRRSGLPPVDVIIPVYDGFEQTQRMLRSVLSSRNTSERRVLVIDDCGPDARIRSLLKRHHDRNPGAYDLILNESNQGFVRTVNIGLARSKGDVIILNADTEVSDFWIDRLAWHADNAPRVGTVTPFSNNGTICNFPGFDGFPSVPGYTSLAEINACLFEENRGRSIELPTGVGFCMYITRGLLDAVGHLDEESFGSGYGEENDLCRRGAKAGFTNLHALDVFVFHEGEASFGSLAVDRKGRERKLLEKHPEYNREVQAAIRMDWAKKQRVRGFLALCARHPDRLGVYLSHGLGGGVDAFLETRIASAPFDGIHLVLRPNIGKRRLLDVEAHFAGRTDHFEIGVAEVEQFAALLAPKRCESHHLMSWSTDAVQVLCAAWPRYSVAVHDFHWLCARTFGLKSDWTRCDLPEDEIECMNCVAGGAHGLWNVDAVGLRHLSEKILGGAEAVICPTRFVAEHVRKVFPDAPVVVEAGEWDAVRPVGRVHKPARSAIRSVCILGSLAPHKGLKLAARVAEHLQTKGLEVVHLGSVSGGGSFPGSLGSYAPAELKDRLASVRPDVIWIPSIAQETYSFTLSEALDSDALVAVNDVGALPERVVGRRGCFVIDHMQPAEQVAEQLIALAKPRMREGAPA